MVITTKIEEFNVSNKFCLISNIIPTTKLKPPFIKSFGLPNSIYMRGTNKNIIPKNEYKQPKKITKISNIII